MASPSSSDSSPSISTTDRTELSILSRLLQTCLRPFRPRLVKAKKEFPAGSHKITVDSTAKKRCAIEERQVDGIWLYDLKASGSPHSVANAKDANSETPPKTHRIYYFAGGGYSQPPSSQHWRFCATVAARLPNTIVTVVSQPLAPNSPAPEAIPQLLRLYSTLLTQSRDAQELVTLAGDSSGGNIALALTLESLKHGGLAPTAVLATCPAADGTKSNPALEQLEKIDPLMTAAFSRQGSEKWRGSWAGDDPRVSPIHGDISLLQRHNVDVIGVTAGHDLLSADGLALRDLCVKHGVRGSWLHWEAQMHCFPLAFGYGLSEAKEAVQWILDALERVRDRSG